MSITYQVLYLYMYICFLSDNWRYIHVFAQQFCFSILPRTAAADQAEAGNRTTSGVACSHSVPEVLST